MATAAMMAQRIEFTDATFDFTAKQDKGDIHAVTPATSWSEESGYGYDFEPAWDGKSNAPFFFSVNVPDGNYRITVTLGSKKKNAVTTVRAESRRLFLDSEATKKGKTVEKTFIVNKRNLSYTDAKGNVKKVNVKEREVTKRNWDDKLTLEFNGAAPAIQQLRIERIECPTIFLCGNSTVVDQDYEPWCSWGQIITRYLDAEVAVANYAESGETAEGFIARGRLAKIVSQMKEGDYIFVEFGHNDQKADKKIGNGAFYAFQHQLKIFYDNAREKGASMVLCTPTRRRHFDDNGKIKDTHVDYPEAMLFMGQREGIPVVDLQKMTKQMYEAWGVEGAKRALVHYPAGTYPGQDKPFADDTHFNPFGATEVAKCVLQGLKSQQHPLAAHIIDFESFDPEHPDMPETFHWDDSPFSEVAKPDGN